MIFPIALAVLWALFAVFLPDSGYDKYFTLTWAQTIMTEGFAHIYSNPEVNYPPLILYLLWFFTWFYESPEALNLTTVNSFKTIVFVFDLLSVLWLWKWAQQFALPFKRFLFLGINMALWYNTVIWGQYDSVPLLFILTAAAFAWQGKTSLSWLALLLAVNAKLQSVIFIPPLVLFSLLRHPLKKREWLQTAGALTGMQLLLWLPFLASGTLVEAVTALWNRSLDFYPAVSLHAFNVWYLVLAKDPFVTSDALSFLGITLRNWGLIFFFSGSAALLWPWAKLFIRKKKLPATRESLSAMLVTLALINLLFFFVNTQMHERYCHIAVWLTGAYFLLSGRAWAHGILSLAYLLNLEAVMGYLHYINIRFLDLPVNIPSWPVFRPEWIALLFLGGGILLLTEWRRTRQSLRPASNKA